MERRLLEQASRLSHEGDSLSKNATSRKESNGSINYRNKRVQWEAFGACVPKEGVVNVTNHSHAKPSTSSVFVDLWDPGPEAVSCSCKDWKYRKPAGGCKHVRFVNSHDALLLAASTPTPSSSEAGEDHE